MTSAPSPEEILTLVRSSPAYVGVHDKAGWLAIFGNPHVVEDPVGSRPVRSTDPGALAKFWDAFIEPNDIEFEVHRDWIEGSDVVRDVTVVTTLSPDVVVRTPAILIYQTADQHGGLRVRRMAAHWESAPVLRQLARPRLAHVRAAVGQSIHLFRTLGLGQTFQFIGAIRGIGRRGKRLLLEELHRVEVTEVSKLISSGRTVSAIGTRDGQPVAVIAQFASRSRELLDVTVYDNLA